ncbi:hypothetical protein F2Q68_00044131 [Brassica cretica]|uniref:Uncharacterized protein n=1 Tax=Brassica cretica TaxID=69181 RepID=A0A8S9LLP3_BRACR|nr:hypothetical protein F2Q68_00044131 [Brassica cretica]
MPNITRSNKEIQLLFSSDPASLECSIRKGRCSSSIDDNTSSSPYSRQLLSTQTPVSSTDTLSPPSTEDTLPSTDTFHQKSIDTSVHTSIDTEPQDMVATLILIGDEKGDMHDREGHMRNAADDDFQQVGKHEKLQEGDFEVESTMSFGGSHWCRSTPDLEHRSMDVNQNRSTASPEHRSTTPTESTASCNAVRIMTHEEFAARHPHPLSPFYVKIDRQIGPTIDRQRGTAIDRQPPTPSIDAHLSHIEDHQRDTLHTKEYDEDYEEERAIEYRIILAEEDRLLHHSSWKRNAMSMDKTIPTSIDTRLHQTSCNRASTDIAYYPSIDTVVDHELHEVFTAEKLLNMRERDEVDQHRPEACGEGTRLSRFFTRATRPSIDIDIPTSNDRRPEFG